MRILTAVLAVSLLVGAGMIGCNKNKNKTNTPNEMMDGGTQSQSFTPPPAQ